MGDDTKIQWTDATWNPLRGCTRVSEGCRNCYAESVAHRFSGPGMPYEGLTTPKGKWTGEVRLISEKLEEPLRWRKPRMVFVNSMSDLFHESVPNDFIAAVFAVMAAAPQHTYQVLTKRPERMRAWFGWVASPRAPKWAIAGAGTLYGVPTRWAKVPPADWPWPLPNVWLGISVEDQRTADERIPLLLETPAVVRWVSYEPALGPVDFRRWSALDWIVAGGESGRGARSCNVAWLRSVVVQCRKADVACFVKQLGAMAVSSPLGDWTAEGMHPAWQVPLPMRLHHPKGGDPAEWPEDLRVREFPR